MSSENPVSMVTPLFAAPFLSVRFKESKGIQEGLRRIILEKREVVPSTSMSNAGGWQSPKDLQTWEGEEIRTVVGWIHLSIYTMLEHCLGEEDLAAFDERWQIVAWANINEHGDFNTLHSHAGGFWSGVYYVQAEEGEEERPFNGVISFNSPTMASLAVDNLNLPEALRGITLPAHNVVPKDGLMLLFPSWLEHQVYPYYGNEPRISISFDVHFPASGGK